MQERRLHKRYPVNAEYSAVDALVTEYATNISRGGVFIRSRTPQNPGTRVAVRVAIHLDGDFVMVEGEGEVVRTVTEGTGSGMGIQFTKLTEESRRAIDRLSQRPG